MIDQQRHRVRKVYTVTLLMSIALGLALAFFLILAFQEHSTPNSVGHAFLFWVGLLSQIVATQLCQRAGLSLKSRRVEIARRKDSAQQASFVTAELRTPRSHWLSLALLLSFLCLLALAMGLSSSLPSDRVVPFVIATFFALVAAPLWTAYGLRSGLIASIDANGVRGKHGFASWKQIASCEITLDSNLLGYLTIPSFAFKNYNDNTLLRIDTAALPKHQTQHFKAVIECYLPGQ